MVISSSTTAGPLEETEELSSSRELPLERESPLRHSPAATSSIPGTVVNSICFCKTFMSGNITRDLTLVDAAQTF
jgi:hypothetical protein